MVKERLLWADSLKGWLILLVILGHAIQSVLRVDCYSNHLWNIIYSFHMPAFMAVSGWLFCGVSSIKPINSDWGGVFKKLQTKSVSIVNTLPRLDNSVIHPQR